MIFGKLPLMDRRNHHLLSLVFISLSLLCSSLALAADVQLPELMQLLTQNRGGQARFVERKYISILDKPVESSGELAFVPPDRLEMRTLAPKAQSLVLEGHKLTMEKDGRSRTVSLTSYPEIAAFTESVRGTLAGDRFALEKLYRLELTGALDQWQLVLTPLNARMSAIVSRIVISGHQADVTRVAFDQADGDRSDMRITRLPD
jgi:outer membrane lipoprotein-sorting protein